MRWRRRPAWAASNPSSTWPTVSPGRSMVSRPPVKPRSGVGMETVIVIRLYLGRDLQGFLSHAGAILFQDPAGQIRRPPFIDSHDHITVPGPRVLAVELGGLRRLIRMGVIVAQDLELGITQLQGDAQEIIRRDQIPPGIIGPPIHHWRDLEHLFEPTDSATQHATAFGGIGRLAGAA